MIQLIKVFLVFLFVLLISSCSQIKLQSQWRTDPIGIDKDLTGWEGVSGEYHEDPSFVTSAVNNDSVLQLLVRFNDPMFARILYSRGFTVWFDKSENFGIDYMGRIADYSAPDRRAQNDSQRTRQFSNFKSLGSDDFTVVEKETGKYFSLSDFTNLEARLGFAEQIYSLELNVPIKTSDSIPGAEIVTGNKVNVILTIKELELTADRTNSDMRASGGMSGGRSGGMSGGRSGGKRGGGGGRPGMGQRPDTGSKEFKIKVTLAENTKI